MADLKTAERTRTAPGVSSEILDRLPPQSLEAERAVLGSLLLDSQMCDEIALMLRREDFYADANQRLYRTLMEMHGEGKPIDITLLRERLIRQGEYEAIGGGAYLAEVAQSVPYAANVTYYAEIVRNKAIVRELIHASTEILRDAWDPTYDPKELISHAEEKIFAVHDQRSSDRVTHIENLLVEAFDRIDARLATGGGDAIPTHFRDLDQLTGGLHPGEFIVLAARPSMGKTALATNIAENVAIHSKVPVLFVSLEMARLELAQRLLCSQGSIDGSKFRNGIISAAEREKLLEASGKLSQSPLYIDDTPTRTVTEIAACARRLKRSQKLGLIVIDYLQLIQPDDPRDPRQEQVAKMARRLEGPGPRVDDSRDLPGAVEPAGGGQRQGRASAALEPLAGIGGHRAGCRRRDVRASRGILSHQGEGRAVGHRRSGSVDRRQAAQRADRRHQAAMEFQLHPLPRLLGTAARGIQPI